MSGDGTTWSTGYVSAKGDRYVYDKNGNTVKLDKNGNPIKPNPLIPKKLNLTKKKKPTLGQKISKKFKAMGMKLKNKISKSFIGKAFRGIGKVAKAVGKTVKFAAKAAFFAAKTFVKASRFVGKAVVGAGAAAVRGVKKLKKMGGKGIKNAIKNFAGAKIVTKLGIKAIKFVGKKIWKGIKKLGLKLLGFLGRLFKIGKGFMNTVGFYASKLGSGIKDKTYLFLVKPISAMMVTAFGFAMGMVTLPV